MSILENSLTAVSRRQRVQQSYREAETVSLEQADIVDDGHLLGSRGLEGKRSENKKTVASKSNGRVSKVIIKVRRKTRNEGMRSPIPVVPIDHAADQL